MCTACALATFSPIVTWRTSGISSKFLFPLLYHMWQRHLTRAYWQFDLVFFAFIIYIVVVFILLIDCLKLLPRKVSILILESDSPMYSVTKFNQFLKYAVVLHILVFLIYIGLLFHSQGLIRVPDGVYHQVFWFLFSTPFIWKLVVTLALTVTPFSVTQFSCLLMYKYIKKLIQCLQFS